MHSPLHVLVEPVRPRKPSTGHRDSKGGRKGRRRRPNQGHLGGTCLHVCSAPVRILATRTRLHNAAARVSGPPRWDRVSGAAPLLTSVSVSSHPTQPGIKAPSSGWSCVAVYLAPPDLQWYLSICMASGQVDRTPVTSCALLFWAPGGRSLSPPSQSAALPLWPCCLHWPWDLPPSAGSGEGAHPRCTPGPQRCPKGAQRLRSSIGPGPVLCSDGGRLPARLSGDKGSLQHRGPVSEGRLSRCRD